MKDILDFVRGVPIKNWMRLLVSIFPLLLVYKWLFPEDLQLIAHLIPDDIPGVGQLSQYTWLYASAMKFTFVLTVMACLGTSFLLVLEVVRERGKPDLRASSASASFGNITVQGSSVFAIMLAYGWLFNIPVWLGNLWTAPLYLLGLWAGPTQMALDLWRAMNTKATQDTPTSRSKAG
jgi:hypothetical protein